MYSVDSPASMLALRHGVKWHDGKPFTAQDVKCIWDLLMDTGEREPSGQSPESLVSLPRSGHHERRLSDHLSSKSKATAAGISDAVR